MKDVRLCVCVMRHASVVHSCLNNQSSAEMEQSAMLIQYKIILFAIMGTIEINCSAVQSCHNYCCLCYGSE